MHVKNEWSDIQPRGIVNFIGNLYLLITFPMRRPVMFFSIIAVIVLLPFVFGVKPADYSLSWYGDHLFLKEIAQYTGNVYTGMKDKFKSKTDEFAQSFSGIVQTVPETKEQPKKATAKIKTNKNDKNGFAVWKVKKGTGPSYKDRLAPKKTFDDFTSSVNKKWKTEKIADKSDEDDNIIENIPFVRYMEDEDISDSESVENALSEKIAEDNKIKEIKVIQEQIEKNKLNLRREKDKKREGIKVISSLQQYYKINPRLNLKYLSEAKHVSGKILVVGPNSFYMNNVYMFLYGIYTDKPFNLDAISYFADLVSGENVECEIIAYSSKSEVATALCFIDGKLINKMMVQKNLARNIALK